MKLARRVLATVAALVMAIAGATAATATPGGGDSWNGTDPAVTGCSGNASTVFARDLHDPATGAYTGRMEVRYSWTCQTNWIRVTNLVPGATTQMNMIRPANQTVGEGQSYFQDLTRETFDGIVYGNQVYVATSLCVHVGAHQFIGGRQVGSSGQSPYIVC